MNYLTNSPTKSNCVVVIPVHSESPSHYELISFKQCFDVLHKYPIYVLAPIDLDLSKYKEVILDFKVISVSKKWLSSRLYYNKLKLSNFFYEFFEDYTYLLTYELDAFIFKDELSYWCEKNYDYIGAPWFEDNDPVQSKMCGAGNSGFSLRKISSIKEGIKHVHVIAPSKFSIMKKQPLLQKIKPLLLNIIGIFSYMESIFYHENKSIQDADFMIEEDTVIVHQMSASLKNFKLAPAEDAYKFSFEVAPDMLFGLNHNNLPTGCHAWWRYNLEFWKPYIEKFGYVL